MENTFYALLFRQKYIKRWGLMRSFEEENLEQHSAEAAILTHALAQIGNTYFGRRYDCARAALIALYHDISEVITGDLPTPIKYYNAAIRDHYHDMEDHAVNTLLSKLPAELQSAYRPYLFDTDADLHRLVKAADKLCAYIKCLEEEKSGNAEFRQAKETISQSLDAMDCPELQWFRTHILPTFSATLDEL